MRFLPPLLLLLPATLSAPPPKPALPPKTPPKLPPPHPSIPACRTPHSLTSYTYNPFGSIGGYPLKLRTSNGTTCCEACFTTANCVAASLFLLSDCVSQLKSSDEDLHMGVRDCEKEMGGDMCMLHITAQGMTPGELRQNGTGLGEGRDEEELYPDICPLGLMRKGSVIKEVGNWNEGVIPGPCWVPGEGPAKRWKEDLKNHYEGPVRNMQEKQDRILYRPKTAWFDWVHEGLLLLNEHPSTDLKNEPEDM